MDLFDLPSLHHHYSLHYLVRCRTSNTSTHPLVGVTNEYTMFFFQIPWPYLFFFLSPTPDFKSLMDNVGSGLRNITKTERVVASTTPSLSLRPRIVSLNVMVAGLSGLGKTTACAALLESWQEQDSPLRFFSQSKNTKKERPKITWVVAPSRQFERFDERTNTILRVRIIDTPGFGNRVNHRDAVRPIVQYMHTCRRKQYQAETGPTLPDADVLQACDDLVHVCLYFLSPGRFLEMDAYFLSRIQHEVCIIPVIAKADTLTDQELADHRAEVVKAFAKEGIVPYNFDKRNEMMKSGNSNNNGNNHSQDSFRRGRRAGEALGLVARDGVYPWGEVRSLDPIHSDLLLVRDLLLSQHTETFVELAREKYGVYRARRIQRRQIGDIIKYAALALLTARALGVPLPFMEHLTPAVALAQLQRLVRAVSRLLTKMLDGTTLVWNSAVQETELPALQDILPSKEDFMPSKKEKSNRLFGWNKSSSE